MRASLSLLNGQKNKALSKDFTEDLIASGYIHQEASGVFNLTALGTIGLRRLEEKLQNSLKEGDVSEWMLSSLQNENNWEKTGRSDVYGQELMSVCLRSKKHMRLSATAEEQITNIMSALQNQKVNHFVYQLGTKWRDEIRARGGLLRGREFRMMDAYSFGETKEDMLKSYQKGKAVLSEFLKTMGCEIRVVQSDTGEIGGLMSEEIQVKTDLDETGWMEVGHSFALGQKYSSSFDLKSRNGEHVWMSCHGLGTTRLLALLLKARRGDQGFFGDEHFSLFDDVIVVLSQSEKIHQAAENLYRKLAKQNRSVLFEDRYTRAGQLLFASEQVCACRRVLFSDRLGFSSAEVYEFDKKENSVVNLESLL